MRSEDTAGRGVCHLICLESWASEGPVGTGTGLLWDSNRIFWHILPTLQTHRSLHGSPGEQRLLICNTHWLPAIHTPNPTQNTPPHTVNCPQGSGLIIPLLFSVVGKAHSLL